MAYNYEYPYVDPGMYNDDWLLNKMKQLVAEWEAMQVKFTTLEEYVKNYFANLDVQDEINNKIDAMIADGSFNSLIMNRVGAYYYFGDILCAGSSLNAGYQIPGSSRKCLDFVFYDASDSVTTIYGSYNICDGSLKDAILSYLSSHANTFRILALMPSPTDITYSQNAIVSSMNTLISAIMNTGKIKSIILLPAPVNNIDVSATNIENYYKINNIIYGNLINCIGLPIQYYPYGYYEQYGEIADTNNNLKSNGGLIFGLIAKAAYIKSKESPTYQYLLINTGNYSGRVTLIPTQIQRYYIIYASISLNSQTTSFSFNLRQKFTESVLSGNPLSISESSVKFHLSSSGMLTSTYTLIAGNYILTGIVGI